MLNPNDTINLTNINFYIVSFHKYEVKCNTYILILDFFICTDKCNIIFIYYVSFEFILSYSLSVYCVIFHFYLDTFQFVWQKLPSVFFIFQFSIQYISIHYCSVSFRYKVHYVLVSYCKMKKRCIVHIKTKYIIVNV